MIENQATSPEVGTSKGSVFEALFKAKDFPVNVYPGSIQRFVEATQRGLNFPNDYIGASVLFAVSAAIGNTIRAEIMPGWRESAVLYLAIVGSPGVSKSHPLALATKTIEERDSANFDKYKRQKAEYDENVTLSKKERAEKGLTSYPTKPAWEQTIVSDATPEALADVHKHNPRGVAVIMDELIGFIKNFDRYNKGSEQEFFLSAWSCKSVRINRKTSEPTYLPLPFISIAGTIQPSVLSGMVKNMAGNGFTDRFLFVFPERIIKKPWGEGVAPEWPAYWSNILNRIMDIPFNTNDKGEPLPRVLQFNGDALKKLKDWQAGIAQQTNRAKSEATAGILAKIEVYAIRFALCLEALRYAANESNLESISLESVNGAIKLAEYFKENAEKVQSLAAKTGLPDIKGAILLLHSLKHNQSQIAKILNISQPYVNRIINESA